MFLVPLVVFLGVKFGFENPVCVKEMTNMRYADHDTTGQDTTDQDIINWDRSDQVIKIQLFKNQDTTDEDQTGLNTIHPDTDGQLTIDQSRA